MKRKTMCVGEIRTSLKLEKIFWEYLRAVADERGIRLSVLVNEIAAKTPDRTNLASELRQYCLMHSREIAKEHESQLAKLAVNNGIDVSAFLDAVPNPSLLVSDENRIVLANEAYTNWLGLEPQSTVGLCLKHVMVLHPLPNGDTRTKVQVTFTAKYISLFQKRVFTAKAIVRPLSGADGTARGNLFIFLIDH